LVASSIGNRGGEVRLFDANTGRPFTTWQVQDRADFISSDLSNPNLFYASLRAGIGVFDKNVGTQVRTLPGLSSPSEIQVPWVPGNQLISNNVSEAKIWDLGSGKVIHSISGLDCARRASLYANVAVVVTAPAMGSFVRLYDLNEGTAQPAKEISYGSVFNDVFVTPKRVMAWTSFGWFSTLFEKH